MSDSSNMSAIDEKNEEINSSNSINFASNIGGFLTSITLLFIVVIVYYSSSGLILYACKLAQSNILPTDVHCYPYEETKPNIKPVQTNIFPTNSEPALSIKISFPYNDYNASNKILNMFRE